jgi:hypothetical protein
MSTLSFDRRVMLPRPGRTLLRASLGLVIPLLFIVTLRLRPHDGSRDIYLMLFGVAQVAAALATGHKEILAATSAFFRPGLRSQLCAAQMIGATIAGLAAVAVGWAALPQTNVAALTTAFAMAVFVYAAMTLLTLHLHWSNQFTIWTTYLTPVVLELASPRRRGTAADPLAHPLPWLLGAVLLTALLARRMLSRSLQRRLSGAMVLGFEDMFRASRMQALRELRGRNARHGQGPRWRSALLKFALTRAIAARHPGREAEVRAWLLAHAGVALTISPRRRVVALYGVLMAGLVVFGGYYDNWLLGNGDKGLFAGMGYTFAAVPLVGICTAMSARLSSPSSRRTGFRSELLALAGAVGATVVLSGVLWAIYGVLATNLPTLSWLGRELTYSSPAPHLNWLMPLLAPFIWLGVALWPRPDSKLPSTMMAGAFLAGYNTILFYPNAGALLIALGLATVAGVVAFERRRRWWQRTDLAV